MPKQPECRGRRKDGRPCTSPLVGPTGYCFAHDPERAAARAAAQERGGQGRAAVVRLHRLCPPRLVPVFEALVQALEEVHAGTLKPAQGLAIAALARAAVAVLQAGELEARLRELEAREQRA